jgi:thiol-disulfide isomerase/thioredoxin
MKPMRARAATLLLLAAGLLASCSHTEGTEKLPDVRLPTLSAQESPSLAACGARRCLTAYVAPWCHYCRESTPLLLNLREFLKARGVETRFVVGKDALAALRGYAREFGPDTMLDVHDVLGIGGVPHFFVSDDKGAILKEVSGVPSGDLPVEEVAAFFGLP